MPATREISIKRGIASIRSRKENEEEERERERGFLQGEKKFSRHCRVVLLDNFSILAIYRGPLSIYTPR